MRRSPESFCARWLVVLVCVACVACSLCSVSPVQAAPSEALDLHFSAPEGCVDAATFRARLLALPVSPVTAGAAPRSAAKVEIVITPQADGFTGEITVRDADGTATARRVSSPRCDEVTDALAFVAALGLGLEATPVARRASPPPAPKAPPPPLPAPPPPASPSPPTRWRFLGALRGTLLSGVGPNFEIAPDVALGLALDGPSVLAPSFELSGAWATSGNIVTTDGAATVTLWSGALTACPLRLALGAGFEVRPCAQFAVGVLTGSASGANVAPTATQVEPRIALAPLARIAWRANDWFSLEAEAGPSFEIARDRFYFDPNGTPVYSAPAVGSLTRLGVVFRWL